MLFYTTPRFSRRHGQDRPPYVPIGAVLNNSFSTSFDISSIFPPAVLAHVSDSADRAPDAEMMG